MSLHTNTHTATHTCKAKAPNQTECKLTRMRIPHEQTTSKNKIPSTNKAASEWWWPNEPANLSVLIEILPNGAIQTKTNKNQITFSNFNVIFPHFFTYDIESITDFKHFCFTCGIQCLQSHVTTIFIIFNQATMMWFYEWEMRWEIFFVIVAEMSSVSSPEHIKGEVWWIISLLKVSP